MWIAAPTSVLVAVAIVTSVTVSQQGPVDVESGSRVLGVVAGPLQLGNVPITRPLLDTVTGQPLRRPAFRSFRGSRLALILQTISADKAPGTEFGVYLDLPSGTQPSPASRQYVGLLVFFDEINHGARKATPSFRTYDVSDLAQRLGADSSAAPLTVTIAATDDVAAGANATVGRVELRVH